MAETQALMLRNAALPTPPEWQTMASMADVLIKSGLLPAHIKTTQAALAIMLKGRELGIPATQALSNIVVVQGKPTCNSELMLALIYRDHGDDAVRITGSTNDHCTISYRRRNWTARQEYTFTIQDAKLAGLTGSQTWQKYPAALLRARCISAVARMAFPDSISGMYSYEEMGATVAVQDDAVVYVDAADQEAPQSTPAPAKRQLPDDAPLSQKGRDVLLGLAEKLLGLTGQVVPVPEGLTNGDARELHVAITDAIAAAEAGDDAAELASLTI